MTKQERLESLNERLTNQTEFSDMFIINGYDTGRENAVSIDTNSCIIIESPMYDDNDNYMELEEYTASKVFDFIKEELENNHHELVRIFSSAFNERSEFKLSMTEKNALMKNPPYDGHICACGSLGACFAEGLDSYILTVYDDHLYEKDHGDKAYVTLPYDVSEDDDFDLDYYEEHVINPLVEVFEKAYDKFHVKTK